MIMKGQKINDRYQIIKTIGEGGMANVYLAYDTILDRNVAVKVLRGDLAGDEKFVRRFQREALSASSLSHPNIVEIYDVGEDEGNFYIVMEYIEGKTLKQIIKKIYNENIKVDLICLIKPQFECGKELADKYKGIILNKSIHKQLIKDLFYYFNSLNFYVKNFTFSPIKGGDGNIEYLVQLSNKNCTNKEVDIDRIVDIAFKS